MKFETDFNFRDAVNIDGDKSIIGVVTAVQFRSSTSAVYEVSWLHNGDSKVAWFENWRLERAEQQ